MCQPRRTRISSTFGMDRQLSNVRRVRPTPAGYKLVWILCANDWREIPFTLVPTSCHQSFSPASVLKDAIAEESLLHFSSTRSISRIKLRSASFSRRSPRLTTCSSLVSNSGGMRVSGAGVMARDCTMKLNYCCFMRQGGADRFRVPNLRRRASRLTTTAGFYVDGSVPRHNERD